MKRCDVNVEVAFDPKFLFPILLPFVSWKGDVLGIPLIFPPSPLLVGRFALQSDRQSLVSISNRNRGLLLTVIL